MHQGRQLSPWGAESQADREGVQAQLWGRRAVTVAPPKLWLPGWWFNWVTESPCLPPLPLAREGTDVLLVPSDGNDNIPPCCRSQGNTSFLLLLLLLTVHVDLLQARSGARKGGLRAQWALESETTQCRLPLEPGEEQTPPEHDSRQEAPLGACVGVGMPCPGQRFHSNGQARHVLAGTGSILGALIEISGSVEASSNSYISRQDLIAQKKILIRVSKSIYSNGAAIDKALPAERSALCRCIGKFPHLMRFGKYC